MPIRLLVALAAALTLASACDDASSADGGVDAGARFDAAPPPVDAGPPPPPATGTFPAHDPTLPFTYDRPDVGTPIDDAERTRITDLYLELLERTAWLDLVEERAHGWPESDPDGGYWYATWWSGAGITKRSGAISYVHVAVGADNNGLRTPQILEGACYAYRLYGNPQDQHLVRRLMRGLSSWHLAMRRSADDPERGLLSRAAYPRSVVDTDRAISIVYDAARPGTDAAPSSYIHVPNNPYWPDLWVKNTRSKDDMGHLMRAVALMDACDGHFTEPGAQDDLTEMRRLFQEWGQRVESDDLHIATYDADLNLFFPSGSLATYFTAAGIECQAEISLHLLSRNDPFGASCRNEGLGTIGDPAPGVTNSSMQIVRTHHESAVGLALVTGNDTLARELEGGLALRIEGILDAFERGEMPDNAHPSDVVQLIVESALLGVPLTSREVSWLHARIEEAHDGYDTSGPEWHVTDASVADGDYALEPGGPGIDFKDLGLLLGTCVAPYVNPSGRPVLDCDRVRAWTRP